MIVVHQDYGHHIEARAAKIIGPWRLYHAAPPGFEWCPTIDAAGIAALREQWGTGPRGARFREAQTRAGWVERAAIPKPLPEPDPEPDLDEFLR